MPPSFSLSRVLSHQVVSLHGARWLSGRTLAVFFLGANVLLTTGCMTYSPAQNMELFVRSAPVPTLVPKGKQLAAAEALAGGDGRSFALVGSGSSMEPMYANGTAVVVNEQHYRTLRVGMPVVYRNSRGLYVAHMLLEDLAGGWLVIGINNREPDEDLVTPSNLAGVITAAFASADTPFRADVAARVALRDGIDRSARVAMFSESKVGRQATAGGNFQP